MGTEIIQAQRRGLRFLSRCVKLNNPLMGAETSFELVLRLL